MIVRFCASFYQSVKWGQLFENGFGDLEWKFLRTYHLLIPIILLQFTNRVFTFCDVNSNERQGKAECTNAINMSEFQSHSCVCCASTDRKLHLKREKTKTKCVVFGIYFVISTVAVNMVLYRKAEFNMLA